MRLHEVTETVGCPRTRATDCSCDSLRQLSEAEQTIEAVAVLGHGDAKGMISFKQAPGKATIISGTITGLAEGLHGFHIHEFGDLSDGCDSAGGHYNPTGVDHGDIDNGHVGDLGNITADSKGVAKFSIKAKRIHLHGPTSIVGRAVVVHKDQDDVGKGGDEESLKTGNAGERAGCGVISLRELTESAIADLDKNISNKHFSRSEMPQVKEPDLQDNDISYVRGIISLDKIKPVQTDRVPGLAQKVAKDFHGKDKPFILDKNNYLVNGHHRYDAARLLGLDRVSVLKVDAPIELLMKKFSHTTSNLVVEDDLDTDVTENFADGKKKGKSKPGRVKKAGASCNGSVTALRKRAKDSSGEKSKMYHWCANMKSGKKKTNEGIPLSPSAELAQDYIEQDIESGKIADLKDIKKAILQLRLSGVIDYNEDARELWKHYVLANHKALPEV